MRFPVAAFPSRRTGITRDPAAPSLVTFVTEWLDLDISLYQRTLLKVLDASPRLTAQEFEAFKLATKRTRYVARHYAMACLICGARSGKDSRIAVPLLLWHALFVDHKASTGEPLIFPLLAQDRLGASTAFNYAQGYLKSLPVLNAQVAEYLTDEIRLVSGNIIRCYPATAAGVSGVSSPFGIMDEVGFLPRQGRDSDVEIEASLFTRMATFPHKGLVKISTPRTPDGILWRDLQRWGEDSDRLLVWCAPTSAMNPSIDLSAYRDLMDPQRFAREFEAQFSDTTEEFISLSMIERVIERGVGERDFDQHIGSYRVAIDASAGGTDYFTICVCHKDAHDQIIQDFIEGHRTNEPGALEQVLDRVVEVAKTYRCIDVHGDRYGGSEKAGLIANALQKRGIRYIVPKKRDEQGQNTESYADKSVCYAQLQNLIFSGGITLLDRPDVPMVREATLLQRTPGPQRDRIDHPKGGHDDFVNALAVAAYVLSTGSGIPAPFARSLGAPSKGGALGTALAGAQPGGGQVEHVMAAYRDRPRPWGGWR